MVTKLDEVTQVKAILTDLSKELSAQKKPYGDYELGIMIETPAAAVMSAEFATRTHLLPLLLCYGIRELSVPAPFVGLVKAAVRSTAIHGKT